jgi:D-alanyl-D-alanine carboxypeptidase/D-alanyl-D-alanine-endopeptidase (penicillin-binding protein 4)
MAHTPHADIYKQSLAIAGQGGTLQNRLRDTVVAGKLWGKTGTLGGTAGLAGYMEIDAQKTRIVVILVNNSVLESPQLRQALDDIVLLAHQC